MDFVFVPKLNYVLQNCICIRDSDILVYSSFLLHLPDASSFAIIKTNTRASNSFNSQRNLLQKTLFMLTEVFWSAYQDYVLTQRFLGMEVYSSTHSSLMPPTSESDSPSFTASMSDVTLLLDEKVCALCARVGRANLKAPFIRTIWWEKNQNLRSSWDAQEPKWFLGLLLSRKQVPLLSI